jgi:hypothetical protein
MLMQKKKKHQSGKGVWGNEYIVNVCTRPRSAKREIVYIYSIVLTAIRIPRMKKISSLAFHSGRAQESLGESPATIFDDS